MIIINLTILHWGNIIASDMIPAICLLPIASFSFHSAKIYLGPFETSMMDGFSLAKKFHHRT